MNEKNISVFGSDVNANDGYLYSNTNKLSCKLSNKRMSDAVCLMAGDVRGKNLIDIGCGDGTYTNELMKMEPALVVGVDANEVAILNAKKKYKKIDNLNFDVMNIYDLPKERKYDIAIVRGLLHHLYNVEKAIHCISRVAHQAIIVEPNGYNPILKIIEKTSPYHVKHEEKSYQPRDLDKWFIKNGGQIADSKFIGLVPIFSPDILAKLCKFFEPIVERTPILRQIGCAQYVQKVIFEN